MVGKWQISRVLMRIGERWILMFCLFYERLPISKTALLQIIEQISFNYMLENIKRHEKAKYMKWQVYVAHFDMLRPFGLPFSFTLESSQCAENWRAFFFTFFFFHRKIVHGKRNLFLNIRMFRFVEQEIKNR